MALTPTGSDWPESIFVLRALGLGDLLTAVPALRGLRCAFPDAEITLATPQPLHELAMLTGAVDVVVSIAGLGELAAAAAPPDLAVNLHGRGPESIADLRTLRPLRLLTHHHRRFPDLVGPSWQSECHEVDRWCQMLAWYGVTCAPDDLHLSVFRTSKHPGAVVIHPGASAMSRRWPVHRYVAVAARLHSLGLPVVITGSARERALAEFVAERAGLPANSVSAGRLSVTDLVAVINDARLLICGDTGVAHIATATATPSVLLFGPTPPSRWGPRSGGPHQVLWRGHTGDPHASRPDAGLLDISTADVLSATEVALSQL
ncbi:glycosyltransferase family 9 protein [Mycolicibacterium frederiksbergense]|uniref:glycosyltransferase family 9 protein n=1 Tax=Mycolicibacterium frederiksbergense TaxID=117567 RepID=UPI00265B909F|nr:glycosyltransferase family 9 protein [Mycolicibacterium frederiksbergense]MDO0973988.1 glycosyltransferase family 9 protein [Mycolicibacterium frederiksbergense]